ncbi:ion transport peptide-like [Limulus polyphemus]|uniref:Ion transport peptide-like n=1 Tax=Limulus polyphemus TaxID=6850 RepID=A0ABM1RZU5_LIMPO|nr:ion transport peptide-like [Limulus polyphemus]
MCSKNTKEIHVLLFVVLGTTSVSPRLQCSTSRHLYGKTTINMCLSLPSIVLVTLLLTTSSSSQLSEKRDFTNQGCMGTYDTTKLARLNRICEECYNIYRDPLIHKTCRSNCFKNDMFTDCIKVLLLESEEQHLNNMAGELFGK